MHLELDKNKIKSGLYIVSTPIGNLGDITLRALDVLKKSNFIICEDTRVAKKLLNYYKIDTKLILNHKFNEARVLKNIKDILLSGNVVSLISDAGTPLVSDPGKLLINECIKNNINLVPIPGPSALTSAISISGFSNNFYFQGFLPDKNSQIRNELLFLSNLPGSIIFFISSKKINKIIPYLKIYFDDRKIVICREITKYFEEFIRDDIKNLNTFEKTLKGELTIVISEKKTQKKSSLLLTESDKVNIKKLINFLSVKDIVKILNIDDRVSKSTIYDFCLKLKNEK